MLSIIFLLIQLGFVLYLLYYLITFLSAAPFVPTTRKAAEAMVTIADIKKGMKVYDLGSGDGRLLFLAASRGAKAVGYELNPILVAWTLVKKLFFRYRNQVTVIWKNLWDADIHDADCVFVYLLPMSINKLQKKLLGELRPGTRVVSNSFIFQNWTITKQDTTNHIFVFTVPKRVK